MYTLKFLDEWIKLHGEGGESPFKTERLRCDTEKKKNVFEHSRSRSLLDENLDEINRLKLKAR